MTVGFSGESTQPVCANTGFAHATRRTEQTQMAWNLFTVKSPGYALRLRKISVFSHKSYQAPTLARIPNEAHPAATKVVRARGAMRNLFGLIKLTALPLRWDGMSEQKS